MLPPTMALSVSKLHQQHLVILDWRVAVKLCEGLIFFFFSYVGYQAKLYKAAEEPII